MHSIQKKELYLNNFYNLKLHISTINALAHFYHDHVATPAVDECTIKVSYRNRTILHSTYTNRKPGNFCSYSAFNARNFSACSSAPVFNWACSFLLSSLKCSGLAGARPSRGCEPRMLNRTSRSVGEFESESADMRSPTASMRAVYDEKGWLASTGIISRWSSGDGSNRVSSTWSWVSRGSEGTVDRDGRSAMIYTVITVQFEGNAIH